MSSQSKLQDVLGGLGDKTIAQLVVDQQAFHHHPEVLGIAAVEAQARPARPLGTTSRSPPVSATMHGQPEAIASSATSPNGS